MAQGRKRVTVPPARVYNAGDFGVKNTGGSRRRGRVNVTLTPGSASAKRRANAQSMRPQLSGTGSTLSTRARQSVLTRVGQTKDRIRRAPQIANAGLIRAKTAARSGMQGASATLGSPNVSMLRTRMQVQRIKDRATGLAVVAQSRAQGSAQKTQKQIEAAKRNLVNAWRTLRGQ
jgi:hypothetical protein